MHIYIDESGIFSNPANRQNIASCVAALVIPSSTKVRLLNEFKTMSARWSSDDGEIKGRLLSEEEIIDTVSLLRRHDVLLEVNAIDLGLHNDHDVTTFKNDIATIVDGWVGDEHPLRPRIREIAESYRRTSNQLFIQSHLMLTLIPRVIQNAITYYARRVPKELKSFHWVIDAKGTTMTTFEEAWNDLIFPSVEFQCQHEPWSEFEGGDYSYFERYHSDGEGVLSRLRSKASSPQKEIVPVSLKMLLGESFKFQDSREKVGLQLADVIANALQRAFNNKLGEKTWAPIGSLIVQRQEQVIPFLVLEARQGVMGAPRRINSPFAKVIDTLSRNVRPMFCDSDREAYLLRRSRIRRKLKAIALTQKRSNQ